MKPEDLVLADVLSFEPGQGIIRLHEQRVVILSGTAMGLLRKELIDTLGTDTARRLLLRFGYADGYHDAVNLRDRSSWANPLDGLRAGAALHTLEGIARVVVVSVDYDAASGRFDSEVEWHDSYVAEQHVQHYGKSEGPACWSLAGYASGYASACLGSEVYFQETACLSQGEGHCSVTGKDAARWGDSLESLRQDFQSADLGKEVERLRAIVHGQLQDLARRERLVSRRERELDALRARVSQAAASKQFVAETAGMRDVLEMAARVAPLDTTVLVYGESGTGKEFIVRLIHDQSPRAAAPFVSINCAALTETLLESELFGHVRGAFTGAVRDKAGLFEVAGNGTIFLDEIGEVAPPVQAKLLRALQEREIRRVGGERHIKINARVVAATNRDLRAAVDAGTFREDLYFRLGAFVITVPPLRDRREDIPPLVDHFVRKYAMQMNRKITHVAPAAMNLIQQYDWPGNVRELENAVERAMVVAHEPELRAEDFVVRPAVPAAPADARTLDEMEKAHILRVLEECSYNQTKAADVLDIDRVTLHHKIKRYGWSRQTVGNR